MTVRLRAHHLLCMLTFIGKGYTQAFTQNYHGIAERLSAGEDILMVEGPDDICGPLLGEDAPHCWKASVTERDTAARASVEALLGHTVADGTRLTPDADMIARLRNAFATGDIRSACTGCEWSALCTGIAAGGFEDVLVCADR